MFFEEPLVSHCQNYMRGEFSQIYFRVYLSFDPFQSTVIFYHVLLGTFSIFHLSAMAILKKKPRIKEITKKNNIYNE